MALKTNKNNLMPILTGLLVKKIMDFAERNIIVYITYFRQSCLRRRTWRLSYKAATCLRLPGSNVFWGRWWNRFWGRWWNRFWELCNRFWGLVELVLKTVEPVLRTYGTGFEASGTGSEDCWNWFWKTVEPVLRPSEPVLRTVEPVRLHVLCGIILTIWAFYFLR